MTFPFLSYRNSLSLDGKVSSSSSSSSAFVVVSAWYWEFEGCWCKPARPLQILSGSIFTASSCGCWSLLCSAILRSRVILHEWLAFYSAFLNIHRNGVLDGADMAGATWNCCRFGASVLCTPCDHAPCHFMQSHIRHVHSCLDVTCSLRFWQKHRVRYVHFPLAMSNRTVELLGDSRRMCCSARQLVKFLTGIITKRLNTEHDTYSIQTPPTCTGTGRLCWTHGFWTAESALCLGKRWSWSEM